MRRAIGTLGSVLLVVGVACSSDGDDSDDTTETSVPVTVVDDDGELDGVDTATEVVNVPDVIGLTVEQAVADLEAVGLMVDVQDSDVDEVVSQQEPAPGELVAVGTFVAFGS